MSLLLRFYVGHNIERLSLLFYFVYFFLLFFQEYGLY